MGSEGDTDVCRIRLSAVESVARMLGVLEVARAFEGLELQGLSREERDERQAFIKNCLLAIMEYLEVDTFLLAFASEEPLFTKSMAERSKTDPNCFATTSNRLFKMRVRRGPFVDPSLDKPTTEDDTGPKTTPLKKLTTFSALENLSFTLGCLCALSAVEGVHYLGAIPSEAYGSIAMRVLQEEELDKYVSVFLPTSRMVDGGQTPGFSQPLAERIKSEQFCFWDTYKRLLNDGREELFSALGASFVESFLSKYTISGVQGQIQQILHTLHKRLIARHEAVSSFEYHRLETIDNNVQQLLETLKQYGIKASTYEEARQQYEKRFAAVPDNDEAIIEREIQALERQVNWLEVEDRLVGKYPGRREFIQRQINKRKQETEGRRPQWNR